MKENKTQFFFSDKPIDLAGITPLEMEYPEKTFSPEPKEITMSFDYKMPKETAEWFEKQMEELNKKEKEILEKYSEIAKRSAEYYLYKIDNTERDEDRKDILKSVIMNSLCKGWNDCFDTNVKREKH